MFLRQVRQFWEENPLSAAKNPHPLGSPEYFTFYDRLREENESGQFSTTFHEYEKFPGERVIDIGCGNGYVLQRYANQKANAYGVDITKVAIEVSRKRLQSTDGVAYFCQSNAEELPFRSATFSCVSSTGVLHHVPDTLQALHECARILKPGGRLILMLYHRNSVLYRFTFLLGGLRTGKSRRTLVNEVDGIGNPKGEVYSKEELQQILSPYFRDIEFKVGLLTAWMFPCRIGGLIPRRMLEWMESRWGWFLYAKAYRR